jgi:hypothetical protein
MNRPLFQPATSPARSAAITAVGAAALIAALAAPRTASAYERQRGTSGGPGLSWKANTVKFHINRSGYSKIPFSQLEPVIKQAFETWNAIDCNSRIKATYGGTNDDPGTLNRVQDVDCTKAADADDCENSVVFQEENWPTDYQGALALTTSLADVESGEIVTSDIEINAVANGGYTFTLTDKPLFAVNDVLNTVTHEVGHFFGLDHPVDASRQNINPNATMYAVATQREFLKRTLFIDDVLGYCAVYARPGALAAAAITATPAKALSPAPTETVAAALSAASPLDAGCRAPTDTPASTLPGALLFGLWGLVGWTRHRARRHTVAGPDLK